MEPALEEDDRERDRADRDEPVAGLDLERVARHRRVEHPDSEERDYSGRYYDFDLYGTLNFSNNFGVTAGYRRLTLGYTVDEDFGDFRMTGYYLMGVARF